jgi:hypothetical protein
MNLVSKGILAGSIASCLSLATVFAQTHVGGGLTGGVTGSTGMGVQGLNNPGQTLNSTSVQGSTDVNGNTTVNADSDTVKKNAAAKVKNTRNAVHNKVDSTRTRVRNVENNAENRVNGDYNADASVSSNAGSTSTNGNVKASSTKGKNGMRKTSVNTDVNAESQPRQ